MAGQPIHFPNGRGQQLSGILDRPPGKPRAVALFAHCFTCGKNLRAAHHISQALVAEGVAVLRFDFTGLGASEGEFAAESFSSNVEDLLSAARFLATEGLAPQILVGHSLGGTAQLLAAPQVPSCVAVVTIGAPAAAEHVARLVAGERATIEREGEAEVSLAGRPFRIRRQFLDDIARQPLPQIVRELQRALLIFHSPADEVVDIANASQLFQHARHPKSFVSLDRADHLLSSNADSRYVGVVLAAWATKYLDQTERGWMLPARAGESVAVCDRDGFLTEVNASGHRLLADEPESAGGTNLGPSPYDLLAAALAACTSMTLQAYARLKAIPLEAALVRVRHDKIHALDCAACETREGRIDRFERVLELQGQLDTEQRRKLLEIADKCPVHRTLTSEVRIDAALV